MITIDDVERLIVHFREIGVAITEERERLIRRDMASVFEAETPGRQVALLQHHQVGYEGPMYFFYRALEGEVLACHPGLLLRPENWPIQHLPQIAEKGLSHELARRRKYLLAGEVNLNGVVIDCGPEAEAMVKADLADIGLTGFHPW